jgi:TorA maturation chaperone TorD
MTEAAPQPMRFSAAASDDSEELQRAELYGLLAGLWLAPPDAALLQQFRVAVTEAPQRGGHLEAPWGDLVAALRNTTLEAAAAEHAALFHGVGRPEVMAYASFYLSGFLNEKPLAVLRNDLAALGLTRDANGLETEDHIAFVLEVMRWLIAGDDLAVCNLEQQRRFFRSHLQPWVAQLCDAVAAQPRAVVWSKVAAMTQAFVLVEAQGFDLLET